MKNSFTMTREQVVSTDAASLKASIVEATGSQSGADSIMRSLERMGSDPSIEYFEMTAVVGERRHPGAVTPAWRVRADRGIVDEPAG